MVYLQASTRDETRVEPNSCGIMRRTTEVYYQDELCPVLLTTTLVLLCRSKRPPASGTNPNVPEKDIPNPPFSVND